MKPRPPLSILFLSLGSTLILSSHLSPVLKTDVFLQVFHIKICRHFFPPSFVPHEPANLTSLISNLTLEGPCITFCNIYTFQRDTQRCSTDCLLMHRCQLYMFRTVTVHPQELLFRCCMCRLWYVVSIYSI